ncbi:MAG: c-type cytochrome [Elusimicrobia bacterium]|nr:c-type cytochrome [Elusimicrobiota bacterium]
MNKKRKVIAAAGTAFLMCGFGSCIWADSDQGKNLFEAKCASCHGKDAKGNSAMTKMFKVDRPALDLVDEETAAKTDVELTATITRGKGRMPAYAEKLKTDEIAGALTYLRVLAPSAAVDSKAESSKDTAPGAPSQQTPEQPPEFILLDKTAKMAPVKFPHKKHADELGGCRSCHEGEKPLFERKRSQEGIKMADIYAGKTCGVCHNGKGHGEHKKVFAAKVSCPKCHKK